MARVRRRKADPWWTCGDAHRRCRHFSCGGKLHGGEEAAGVQSYASGLECILWIRSRRFSARCAAGYRAQADAAALPVDFVDHTAATGSGGHRAAGGDSHRRMWRCCAPDGRATGDDAAASSRRCGAIVPGPGEPGPRALVERAWHLRRRLGYCGLRDSAGQQRCRCTSTCWWKAASTLSSA